MENLDRNRLAGSRRAVWIGLGLAVALDTATPLLWKSALMRLPEGPLSEILLAVFHQPLFAVAAVLIALQFFNWMSVLSMADVSFAQPITALSYITVTLLAAAIFNEKLMAAHFAGIALILAGVWLISGTPHQTSLSAVLPDASPPEIQR